MGADIFQYNLLSLQNNLYNFAMMLTSNRDNAYDLVQDTTLKALDNRDKYVEGSNFKGWVFTIMRNTFINNYRRAANAATMVDTTDNLYHINLAADRGLEMPEDSYTAKEINEAIDEFDDALATPFKMYIVGYKYDEISAKLNIPLGTVKSRIFQVRKRLQVHFAEYR